MAKNRNVFSFEQPLDCLQFNSSLPSVNGVIDFPVTGWVWWSLLAVRWRHVAAGAGTAAIIRVFGGGLLVYEAVCPNLLTIAVEQHVVAAVFSPNLSPVTSIAGISIPAAPIFGDGSFSLLADTVNVADVMAFTCCTIVGKLS